VGAGEDNLSFLPDNFRERHDLEQYFFTRDCISSLINAFTLAYPSDIEKKLCLICAPSLAKAFLDDYDVKVPILDIDDRFKDLPGYRHWDLQSPEPFENEFDLIFIDPPFFYISLEQMAEAVRVLMKSSRSKDPRLMISFMIRDEAKVKQAFKEFGLERSNFELEYATVKPNRWDNYALYTNVDIPFIKRVKRK